VKRRQLLKKLRTKARELTVGKRAHLYTHVATKMRQYPGPLRIVIPMQMYTFVLHPQCTRAVYKKLKKASVAPSPTSPRHPGPHFASRKGIDNIQPKFKPRETDAEVTARLVRKARSESYASQHT